MSNLEISSHRANQPVSPWILDTNMAGKGIRELSAEFGSIAKTAAQSGKGGLARLAFGSA
jgi:hypothetical protein